MMRRRTVLVGTALLSTWARLAGAAQPTALSRDDWVARGEALLQQGQADAALQAFEQAGAMGHDPAIELGMVRAAIQAGRCRQALAFAAHTAGEHGGDARCVAAYVWLLQRVGQGPLARQLVDASLGMMASSADRELIQAVDRMGQQPWPGVPSACRIAPCRLAPYAHGEAVPAACRLVASGTLLMGQDGAQRVVAPAADALVNAASCWLRDGLGRTVVGMREGSPLDDRITVWRVQGKGLQGSAPLAARDAFPGAPIYTAAYALAVEAQPTATAAEAAHAPAAWPVMRMGFAGGLDRAYGRLLGIDGPSGAWSHAEPVVNPLGGPVWDAAGHLVGIALSGPSKGAPDSMLTQSIMRQCPWLGSPPRADASAGRLSAEELYEQSLRHAVQMLALP